MITWIECSEERYDEMLCVLPPAAQDDTGAFLVGEACDFRNGRPTFDAFKRENERYSNSAEPVTFAEFKAEHPTAQYYY